MQINLGVKIKELRKRDKRKQEDLALALGVGQRIEGDTNSKLFFRHLSH